MNSLEIIASHMIGDYVFQTNEEGRFKRINPKLRRKHVAKYVLAFFPLLLLNKVSSKKIVMFTLLNFLIHYAADSYKYSPNPPGFPRSIYDRSVHSRSHSNPT